MKSNTPLLQTVIHGLATSMGSRVLAMALRFVTIFLLPFWLTPAEIGFVALIMACINIPAAFADLGFGTALIKEKSCNDAMFSSVYTLSLLTSTLMAIALILGANGIQNALSLPAIMITIGAFALPFSVLAIVPNAILQRNLRFTSLAARDLTGELAFSCTAITLCVLNFGPIAIAFALVAQRIVRWLTASFAVDWKPKPKLHAPAIRTLMRFSIFQLGSLSLNQIFNNLDKLLIAALLSPTTLGFYAQSQQLTIAPVQSFIGGINNVFFASFAKLQNDEEKMRALFRKLFQGLLVASFTLMAIMFPAMTLIPVIYGSDWQPSVPIARILCLALPFCCASILEGIMIAIGGERRRLISAITKLTLMAGGILALFTLLPDFANPMTIAVIACLAYAAATFNNAHFILKRLRLPILKDKNTLRAMALSLCIATTSILLTLMLG